MRACRLSEEGVRVGGAVVELISVQEREDGGDKRIGKDCPN